MLRLGSNFLFDTPHYRILKAGAKLAKKKTKGKQKEKKFPGVYQLCSNSNAKDVDTYVYLFQKGTSPDVRTTEKCREIKQAQRLRTRADTEVMNYKCSGENMAIGMQTIAENLENESDEVHKSIADPPNLLAGQ